MKKLLFAAALVCAALLSPLAGLAQVVSYTTTADGVRITVPVTPTTPLPTTGGGGGGGSLTFQANASPQTSTEGATGVPGSTDLHRQLRILPGLPSGAAFDLSAPAVMAGKDGVLAASVSNPSAVEVENTITANLGTIAGVATAAKQPAFGTTGAPSADIITIQGNASGVGVPVLSANAANFLATILGGGPGNTPGTAQAGSLLTGCTYKATMPSPTDAQQVSCTTGSRGAVMVQVMAQDATTTPAILTSAADGAPAGRAGFYGYSRLQWNNGSTYDMAKGDLTGLATMPYGITAQRWAFASASGGISNTTTAVTIKGAVAGLRNCIVSLDLDADALGAATEFAVRDGAATVLYRTKIGTGGLTGRTVEMPAGVCGAVNSLLEVVTLTATITGAIYPNATGFVEP